VVDFSKPGSVQYELPSHASERATVAPHDGDVTKNDDDKETVADVNDYVTERGPTRTAV